MNENNNERQDIKPFRYYKPLFFLIVCCILVFALIWYYKNVAETINYYLSYLAPVLYGVFIAFLLNPVMKYFYSKLYSRYIKSPKEKLRNNAEVRAKRRSIAIAVLIGFLAVLLLASLIIPELLNSIIKLGKDMPELVNKATKKIAELNSDRSWAGSFQKYLDTILEQLETWFSQTVLPGATQAITTITTAAWNVVKFVFSFLVGFIIAVYVLKEKAFFTKWSKKILFAICKPESANLFLDTARLGNKVFGRYLIGSILDSTMVGLICFAFNIISGMPYALLIAAIVGITNVIPFFGPFLGAIPSTILILIIDPIKAVIFVIFILVLQQIEGNVLAPKILGNITGISEFGVTFALLFFGATFGVIGMILGVPMLAVVTYFIKTLTDKRMNKKGLETDPDFYLEVDKYDNESNQFTFIDHSLDDEKPEVKPKYERTAVMMHNFNEKVKSKIKKKK